MKRIFMLGNIIPNSFWHAQECLVDRFLHPSLAYLQKEVESNLQQGICENAAWSLVLAQHSIYDGVICSTRCDQMRHIVKKQKRLFLYDVPQVPSAQMLRTLENERLTHFIKTLDPIEIPPPLPNPEKKYTKPIRLLLLGSAMLFGTDKLSEILSQYQSCIAVNWSENSSEFVMKEHPFDRPNEAFHLNLDNQLNGLHGVIIIRTTWCDQYRGLAARLKERLNYPVLELIITPGPSTWQQPQILTRLGAFLEQLQ